MKDEWRNVIKRNKLKEKRDVESEMKVNERWMKKCNKEEWLKRKESHEKWDEGKWKVNGRGIKETRNEHEKENEEM